MFSMHTPRPKCLTQTWQETETTEPNCHLVTEYLFGRNA